MTGGEGDANGGGVRGGDGGGGGDGGEGDEGGRACRECQYCPDSSGGASRSSLQEKNGLEGFYLEVVVVLVIYVMQ